MYAAAMSVDLRLRDVHSLKEKRHVMTSLRNVVESKFSVSFAEVDHQDKWQRAVIAVCILDSDRRHLESDVSKVCQLCEAARDLQVASMHQQWL